MTTAPCFTFTQIPGALLLGILFGLAIAHLIPGHGPKLKLITSFLLISLMAMFGFAFDVYENYTLGSNFLATHMINWLSGVCAIYGGIWLRLFIDKHLEAYYTERAKHPHGYTAVPNQERNIRSINR